MVTVWAFAPDPNAITEHMTSAPPMIDRFMLFPPFEQIFHESFKRGFSPTVKAKRRLRAVTRSRSTGPFQSYPSSESRANFLAAPTDGTSKCQP
jgi:hypothetical protein